MSEKIHSVQSYIKLLVDDRERDVIMKLQEQPTLAINWAATRLNNGDFSIINTNTNATIAMIERKTHQDFAQSIKDGRMENIARMVELARSCSPQPRVGILLEGDYNLHENTCIAGISFKSIRSKINHLWLRDNVCLIQTANTLETVQYLISLTESVRTIKTLAQSPQHTGGDGIPAACRPVAAQTIEQIALAMFMQLPKIGCVRAQKLIASGQTVAQFITKSQILYDEKNAITIAILTTIKGMSEERARTLLSHVGGTLQQFANASPDMLTTTLAKRAHDALNYCANVARE